MAADPQNGRNGFAGTGVAEGWFGVAVGCDATAEVAVTGVDEDGFEVAVDCTSDVGVAVTRQCIFISASP